MTSSDNRFLLHFSHENDFAKLIFNDFSLTEKLREHGAQLIFSHEKIYCLTEFKNIPENIITFCHFI